MEKRTFPAIQLAHFFAVLALASAIPPAPLLAQPAPPLAEQLTLATDRGDWPSAVEITRRLLSESPDDPGLLARLARYQHRSGDLERAAASVARAIKLPGDPSAEVLEIRGDIARDEKRPADALSDYQLALRADPRAVRVLEKLAAHHLKAGDSDSATIYYKKLAALRENSRDHLHLARAALRQRDWTAVVDHLTLADEFHRGRLKIANYESLLNQAVQLRRLDRKIKRDRKDTLALLDRARLFHSCGFPEEALDDAQRAARIDARAPHVRLALGFYHKANGDHRKGAEFNVNARALGARYLDSELADLDRDIRKKPESHSLRHQRAQLLFSIGQASLALEDIEFLLEQQPGSIAALLLKVDALQRLGRGVEARQIIRDLAARHPDAADVLQQVGQIQMEDGHYQAAIATFDKILRDRPGHEPARNSRSLCYKRLQQQPQS